MRLDCTTPASMPRANSTTASFDMLPGDQDRNGGVLSDVLTVFEHRQYGAVFDTTAWLSAGSEKQGHVHVEGFCVTSKPRDTRDNRSASV
jgi:hypothetical protein